MFAPISTVTPTNPQVEVVTGGKSRLFYLHFVSIDNITRMVAPSLYIVTSMVYPPFLSENLIDQTPGWRQKENGGSVGMSVLLKVQVGPIRSYALTLGDTTGRPVTRSVNEANPNLNPKPNPNNIPSTFYRILQAMFPSRNDLSQI